MKYLFGLRLCCTLILFSCSSIGEGEFDCAEVTPNSVNFDYEQFQNERAEWNTLVLNDYEYDYICPAGTTKVVQ